MPKVNLPNLRETNLLRRSKIIDLSERELVLVYTQVTRTQSKERRTGPTLGIIERVTIEWNKRTKLDFFYPAVRLRPPFYFGEAPILSPEISAVSIGSQFIDEIYQGKEAIQQRLLKHKDGVEEYAEIVARMRAPYKVIGLGNRF